MILIHVIIALSSIIFASYLMIKPNQSKLNTNYGLIAATIVSGTYLIVTTHINMLSTCLSGLAYLSIVAALSALAQRKLAIKTSK